MKKIMLLVLSLVMILTVLPSASFAYTGGLLNGQLAKAGNFYKHDAGFGTIYFGQTRFKLLMAIGGHA